MLITFKPNGLIIGHNVQEEIDFMKQLGEIEITGTAKIEKECISDSIYIFKIWDEEGHICKKCRAKKNTLVRIVNEGALQISEMCDTCYYV